MANGLEGNKKVAEEKRDDKKGQADSATTKVKRNERKRSKKEGPNRNGGGGGACSSLKGPQSATPSTEGTVETGLGVAVIEEWSSLDVTHMGTGTEVPSLFCSSFRSHPSFTSA